MWTEILFAFILFILLWAYLRPSAHLVQLGEKIPGPKAYPIIGNLLDIPSNNSEGLITRAQMIKTYGHINRLWVANHLIILISDPKDAEVLLNSTTHIEKSSQYDFFHPWLGTGLLTSSGEKWHLRRKAITPTFHFKILEQFIDVFNKNGDILIKCLNGNVDKSHFNIQPFISRYALDVICESAMGTEVNAQTDTNSEYVEAVRRICEVIFNRMRKPWLRNTILFAMFGGLAAQTKALKILHGLTNKVIENKKKRLALNDNSGYSDSTNLGVKRKTAFLELLLNMLSKTSKIFVKDDDIREEVDTFMFEGHDTTTSALCFTLYLLAKHPQVQEKIIQEMKEIGVFDVQATYQNLMEMKYLERVIKESLRLYPSVPIVARQIKQDVKVNTGNYILPAGCIVGISAYFIHRNSEHYKEPEIFNPDNFLSDRIAQSHAYSYIPFSAGPRNCIGQKFAMLELKATLVKILNNYELEYAGPEWDVIPKPTLILQSENGFHIKLKKRRKEVAIDGRHDLR